MCPAVAIPARQPSRVGSSYPPLANCPPEIPPDGVLWSDTFRMPACLPILSAGLRACPAVHPICMPVVWMYLCVCECVLSEPILPYCYVSVDHRSVLRRTWFYHITHFKSETMMLHLQSRFVVCIPITFRFTQVSFFCCCQQSTFRHYVLQFIFGFLDTIFKILTEQKRERKN